MYETTWKPPGPVCGVTIADPQTGGLPVQLPGKVDSGADITVIPKGVVASLQLERKGWSWLRGTASGRHMRPLYVANLQVEGYDVGTLQCVAASRGNVLLGRGALNYFVLTLDGPNLTLTLAR